LNRPYFINPDASDDVSISYLLGIIQDARATTLRYVDKISTEELHWQYSSGWNTIAALLSHFIACNHVFRIEFIEEREMTEQEEQLFLPGLELGKYIPSLITNDPISFYLEKLEDSYLELTDAIRTIPKEKLWARREGYDEAGCNLVWILYHQAEDEVHHRGQISILRKLYAARAI
jgi:uncharacterized damage-inducible protein DinB